MIVGDYWWLLKAIDDVDDYWIISYKYGTAQLRLRQEYEAHITSQPQGSVLGCTTLPSGRGGRGAHLETQSSEAPSCYWDISRVRSAVWAGGVTHINPKRERERGLLFLYTVNICSILQLVFWRSERYQHVSNSYDVICYILTERERLASDLEPKCSLLQESRDGNTGDNPLTFWQRFTTPLTVLT